MRPFSVLCALLFVSCGYAQVLVAPCLSESVTDAGGLCPPCNVHSDCEIRSNACERQSYCVAKTSSWQVSKVTCDPKDEIPTANNFCVCFANKCDWTNLQPKN